LPSRAAPRRDSPFARPADCVSRTFWRSLPPPEQTTAFWSCSSSHNPLGNCISARPETGLGPDSARSRFLSSRLTAQLLLSHQSSRLASTGTGTVATPSRGTGDICLLKRREPRRGEAHQLRSAFPRLPGRIPVAPSAGFSYRRALDCSIKERRRKCCRAYPKSTLSYHQVAHRCAR
jgi:hypothetical protein